MREDIQEYRRRYYQEHKEELKEYAKHYRLKNKEALNRKGRERYASNREECLSKVKDYRNRNIERYREYEKSRHSAFTEKVVDYLGGECLICGLRDNPEVYDVHHIDPCQKKHNIGKLTRKSWKDVVVPELEKCCLLCAPCHRKLHAGRFDDRVKSLDIVLTPGRVTHNREAS